MKIKGGIFCTVQFAMCHYWTNAKGNQLYLKHDHRHLFHVKAYKDVTDDDRQIEFIALKEEITTYVREKFEYKTLQMSCEAIAQDILERFDLSMVEVSEDGENGAYVLTDRVEPKPDPEKSTRSAAGFGPPKLPAL